MTQNFSIIIIKKTYQQFFVNRMIFLLLGLAARLVGIMPEKAMKMQAWTTVGRYMERNYENLTYTKWIVAGAMAGAATTLIGNYNYNEICMKPKYL